MGHSRFYSALTALLFAALCAWLAAALPEGRPAPQAAEAAAQGRDDGSRLHGIVLRREEAVSSGAAAEGKRLAAGELFPGGKSCMYFASSDGYEHISPEDVCSLSPQKLLELMQSPPQKSGEARLVYGFDCYFAAVYEGNEDIKPGPCKLRFDAVDRNCQGEIVSVCRENGECAVLLRLLVNDIRLYRLRFCSAELYC